MCGFVGFTTPFGDLDECRDLAARMLTAVVHRGPFGASWHAWKGVTMAHCALPFVDREHAVQPFVSSSRRTAVVFNGEIYNHQALRRELASVGVPLRTNGDTELLVELYEREGMAFLDRLRGMFAFVLHDAARQRLILVRDPFGKKPVYYRHTAGGTVFASELGALLAHPAVPRAVDPAAVADYLTVQAFPAPGTVLSGVRKVRPGSYVTIHADAVQETGYYQPRLADDRSRVGLRAQTRELSGLLHTAVERRLTSTAEPFGVLLSGGLDSSAVAAVAARVAGGPLPTFCARFADPAFDESRHAEAVARHLGLEFHPVPVDGAALAGVVDTELRAIDEPLADPSLLPTVLVCRAARHTVRGVLTGDGADEILLGYRFFQAERVIEALLRVAPDRLLDRVAGMTGPGPASGGNLPVRSAAALLARGLRTSPERRFYESTRPFSGAELVRVLTADARAAIGEHRPYRELDRFLSVGGERLTALERSQLGMICHFLRDVILTKVDRGSMFSALEARSPFLDVDVVDYCARLPVDRKLHGLTGKYLLRRLASNWLPPEVVRRRKLGFRAPISSVLREELAPLVREALSPDALACSALFDPAVVRRLVDEHTTRHRDHGRKLWALLCFQLWYEGTRRTASEARHRIDVRPVGADHAT